MSAPDSIYGLVEKFERDKPGSETEVRVQFVDELFRALGWDMRDKRQVRHEPRVIIKEAGLERSKRPDYSFHIGNPPDFFVETKMPHVNLERNPIPAFQLRRYGWSGNAPVSVLTDFEEFSVYDCRIQPQRSDPANKARLRYFQYGEYIDQWDELEARFSREAVAQGALREWVEGERVRGVFSVDQAFLREMENWRETLAQEIALHNRALSQRQLNLLVQRTIDRIVFLRIAEDRNIELYGRLRSAAAAGKQVYEELKVLFNEADDKYNSGLFHFGAEARASEPDSLSLNMHIPDAPLRRIIKSLYFPYSPYEFSVLSADILGQVYEQFLGKVIEISGGVRVEEKPEVRKAGGVYYTPAYIVDYIVENTVGALLDGATPEAAAQLRILDPACGSGSFLTGAYQYLLDWHLKYYREHPTQYRNRRREIAGKDMILTTVEKRRILENNIYGVDLDQNAVEVSKLSLLLKMLENEDGSDATGLQTVMFSAGERILPDLSGNIKWGNSLIGSDFYSGEQMTLFDDEALLKVKPFDWDSAEGFGEIMAAGGFDAVIGNPPWLMAGYYSKDTLKHLKKMWTTAKGKFDLYYLFVELATKLCNEEGKLGVIVPNKLFHTRSASELRKLLWRENWLKHIVDFGDEQIFADATNYSCILLMQRDSEDRTLYSKALKGLVVTQEFLVQPDTFASKIWSFVNEETHQLFNKLKSVGHPLSDLVQRFGTGVQTGADKILTHTEQRVLSLGLENEVLKPILRGRDVRRYFAAEASKQTVFPYEVQSNTFEILDESDLKTFQNVFALLQANRQKLGSRIWFGKSAHELSGKWYGMMYLDSYNAFSAPHILTPSLTNTSNFTLGTGDLFVTGTAGVTSVIPKSDVKEDIKYLLGTLNSSLLSFYLTHNSPVFSGGYYKFSAPYLKELPIRTIDFDNPADVALHDKMVALVDNMLGWHRQLPGLAGEARRIAQSQIERTDREIDELVYALYGLSEDEVGVVEGA